MKVNVNIHKKVIMFMLLLGKLDTTLCRNSSSCVVLGSVYTCIYLWRVEESGELAERDNELIEHLVLFIVSSNRGTHTEE